MHILILGGTGPCGIQLIQQSLELNHTVVVYARSPQKLPTDISANPSVTVVQGELADVEKLSSAMQGVHAVLSALGPAVTNGPFHPNNTPLAHAYALIIETMKQQNVKRLIALGTPSMKDEHDKFSLVMSTLVTGVATFAHNAYKDVVAIGETIRAADPHELVWTIARVPILNDREDRSVIAGYVGDGKVGLRLARPAFGAFVLGELEQNEWCHKAPLISSRYDAEGELTLSQDQAGLIWTRSSLHISDKRAIKLFIDALSSFNINRPQMCYTGWTPAQLMGEGHCSYNFMSDSVLQNPIPSLVWLESPGHFAWLSQMD